MMMILLWRAVSDFFHARTGAAGVQFAGWMRVAFAILFLVDRLLLGWDLPYLMSSKGLVPFSVGRAASYLSWREWSLLQLAPESDLWLYFLHALGLVHGLLLLLGIQPRAQLFGMYLHLTSFYHHNQLLWDGQDNMFRMWTIMLMLLPLHRVTLYDAFATKKKKKSQNTNDSWPMWPFRIWQVEMCLVYMGAAFGKLDGSVWWPDGTAVYYVSYTNDFYPGIFNPECIFNRMPALKLICWSAIVLETATIFLIWVPVFRKAIFWSVVVFHVGLDVTMNMHCFEWLTILGFSTFLVEPDLNLPRGPPKLGRYIVDSLVAALILVAFVTDATPFRNIESIAMDSLKPAVNIAWEVSDAIHHKLAPFLSLTATYQGKWTMFDGTPDHTNYFWEATIILDNNTSTEWHSPLWSEMNNFVRKRYMRQMDYYEYLENGYTGPAVIHLCHYLARQQQQGGEETVRRVELYRYWEEGLPPRHGLGWFVPARQELRTGGGWLMSLHKCRDLKSECAKWAAQGECEENTDWMIDHCPKSCNVRDCDYWVEWGPEGRDYIVSRYEKEYDEDDDDEDEEEFEEEDDDEGEEEFDEEDKEDGDGSPDIPDWQASTDTDDSKQEL